MPMTIQEKMTGKAVLRRRLLTLPIIICSVLAFLVFCIYAFQWARGHLLWHKEEVEVISVTSTQSRLFEYVDKDNILHHGSMAQPKLFYCLPIGKYYAEGDTLSIAYNLKRPEQHTAFPYVESMMLTWIIIAVVLFVLYFWVDTMVKKHSKVKLDG